MGVFSPSFSVSEPEVDGLERSLRSLRQDALASGRLEVVQTANEDHPQNAEPGVGRARRVSRHLGGRPQLEDVATVGSGRGHVRLRLHWRTPLGAEESQVGRAAQLLRDAGRKAGGELLLSITGCIVRT